ncbi:MAG: VCBS repeat-containing protein [Bacteroidota bacterium]
MYKKNFSSTFAMPMLYRFLLLFVWSYGMLPSLHAQVDFYFTPPNGWSMDRHHRTVADVDGDGKADIIGFGEKGVFVSFSDGQNFSIPQLLVNNFSIAVGGWQVNEHVRTVADVNGDGKADIVGFGGGKVLVALSQGRTFGAPSVWLEHDLSTRNGWNNREHVRTATDVNGDGMADLVGFGGAGVFVAFSNGRSFSKPEMLIKNFAIGAGGWEVAKHTRLVADIDNDQRADIVAFGGNVFTARSTGTRFAEPSRLDQMSFFINPNWWNLKRHRRMMADVNGDGSADIVGFTEYKVYVALAVGGSFDTQRMCFEEFNYAQGWSPAKYPIAMGDVNGDGKEDIIGFKDDRVYVALSDGRCFGSARAVSFR